MESTWILKNPHANQAIDACIKNEFPLLISQILHTDKYRQLNWNSYIIYKRKHYRSEHKRIKLATSYVIQNSP